MEQVVGEKHGLSKLQDQKRRPGETDISGLSNQASP